MGDASGFAFSRLGDVVVVTHRGRKAATLRGSAAARFLEDVERGDPQQVMARATATTSEATNGSPVITGATADDAASAVLSGSLRG